VFWVNLPLAAVLVAAVRAVVPPQACRAGVRHSSATGLDVPGATLLTGAVMAVVLGAALLENPDRVTTGLLAVVAGAALLAGFAAVERRVPAPLLPVAAVREPGLRAGVGAAALNTATTSSAVTLATLHLQQDRGVGAAAAALWLLPCSAGVVAGSVAAGRLMRRCTARTGIAAGLAVVAIGDALLLALPLAETLLPVGVAVAGAGLGLSSVAANTLGTAVPDDLQGVATGALNTGAQLGTALGVSALLLLAARTQSAELPLTGAPLGWAAAAVLAACGALLVTRAPRSSADRA
jgi:predicted MFS family arabinose efflux permease